MARYQDELEKLYFTQAEKENLIGQLLKEKADLGTKSRRFSYQLVAFVAVIFLLIGAAGAVSLAGLSPQFRALFGITDQKQAENLGAVAIEKIFADEKGSGASITVKEVVCDQERLYILLEFAAPPGIILPAPDFSQNEKGYWLWGSDTKTSIPDFFAEETCTQRVDIYGGYSYGSQALPDENPGDHRVLILYTITTDLGFSQEARFCRIPSISSLWTTQGGKAVALLENMEFNLVVPIAANGNQSYSFDGRCSVKLGGTTMAVVENLSVSPISISLDLVIPDGDLYDEILARQGPWPVYVLLQDGAKIAAHYQGQSGGRVYRFYQPDGTLFFRADHAVFTLEHPIDVGEIADIVFVGDNDPVGEQPDISGKIVHFMFTPGNFFNNTYWDTVNQTWMKTKN